MENDLLINNVDAFVRNKLSNEKSGHDFNHISRVVKLSKKILIHEPNADYKIVIISAYVHDLVDPKVANDTKKSQNDLELFLLSQGLSNENIKKIFEIISHISYSKNLKNHYKLSLEGQIVQDSDRLDAIGAIGIARAFYYGGHKGEKIYDPNITPRKQMSYEQYRSQGTVINHFYEKLFKLKNQMNTTYAKSIADIRNRRMQKFINEFKDEWNGQE